MNALKHLGKRFPVQKWLWAELGLRLTKAGVGYLGVWIGLLVTGLYQQYNLILLTAGLAAGPLAASFLMSKTMLRRLTLTRRLPQFLFAGDPLALDYTLKNERLTTAALAIEVHEELDPEDRSIPGAERLKPQITFERVGPGSAQPLRWQGPALERGRYLMSHTDLVTRSPFGLVERRMTIDLSQALVVYPRIGNLTRRWHQLQRSSRESRSGRRHDRTAQQQEYHGLRDYRSGDSPRWIHWRTSARSGELMVKEFEQENDQQLAVLLDPWLPRSRVTTAHRETLEQAIRFAATVCAEACRRGGRNLVLGWTGTMPVVRQGPASLRLLHELLGMLALVKGSTEGKLTSLFEALPPSVVRDAVIVLVSTRPLNLDEELARSRLLAEAAARGLSSRLHVLDASRGDLDAYIDFKSTATEIFDPSRSEATISSDSAHTRAGANGSSS